MSTLKLKLKRVDPVKYATVTTAVTLCIMIVVFLPFMLIFSAIGASSDLGGGAALLGGGIIGMLFGIVIYGVIIFVATLIGSMVLNFVLKKTNGLDLEFEKSDLDIAQIGNE